MLKTVGASGQISLGKKFAGRHYQMEIAQNGAVTLLPMQVTAAKPRGARRKPRFQVVKVEKFIALTREELHERGPVP